MSELHLSRDEAQEWHEYVLMQRNKYKSILEDIVSGVPKCLGMASDYRQLTLIEIKRIAKEALRDSL